MVSEPELLRCFGMLLSLWMQCLRIQTVTLMRKPGSASPMMPSPWAVFLFVEHVDLVRSMEAYSALHIHCRTDGIMRKMCQWNVRFVIGNANFARPFSEFVPVLGV